MANKVQIKKYLESKREEAVEKLSLERDKSKEAALNSFFDAYKEKFENIQDQVIATANAYDRLVKMIEGFGSAEFKHRYNCPPSVFNELIDKLSVSNLKKYYVTVSESEKIHNTYENRIEDVKKEYNNLIAICQARPASESIKALDEIGFDISMIEIRPEQCTTLITAIDATKLFV